ncbi:MAG: IS4 family transposase, partial [Methylomarinum sp.]|nr:IS4 family transposase [Methylomarinum sp.]
KNSSRLSFRLQIRSFKNAFFQFNDLPFKGLISDRLIEEIHQSGDVRSTIFTPLVTLRAFLFQALSSTGACKEAVAHILTERIGLDYHANSMNTGPYCKARLRLQLPHLKEAVSSSGQALHEQASKSWLWNGYQVVLVDGTTFLMPDTKSNQKSYPQQHAQKPRLGFPIMRLVGLLSLSTGGCMNYATGSYQGKGKGTGKGTGETSLFSRLIRFLGSRDLLLADRYYTSYANYVLLTQQGTPLVFRQRSTVKSDFRRGQRLGAKDHIISVKKPKKKPIWMSDEAWTEMPAEFLIREFAVKGIVYVTTLMDAKTYPKKALAELYQERWKIEVDFRTLKTHMGMDMFRCKTADMIDKEIAIHLLAYNLIRVNLARAACINNKLPHHLSFMATVQLMRNMASLCITMTGAVLGKLMPAILMAITQTAVEQQKRPNQPRVIKRRPKAYSLMTKPRIEYATT